MIAMRVPGALLLVLLLPGCAGSTDEAGPEPEPEVTTFVDPTPEATEATQATAADPGGGEGNDAVSVELPGLPIGGGGAVFSEPGVPQCLSVNLTGDPLPAGVGVVIEEFTVPHPFALSADLCGDAPPCLGGPVLDPVEGGSCEVAVEWTGEDGTSGSLGVAQATGRCEDPAACASAAEIVAAAAPQSLPLTLQPAEPEPEPGAEPGAEPETGTGPATGTEPTTEDGTEPETEPEPEDGTSTEPSP